jgi:hypothetical protein
VCRCLFIVYEVGCLTDDLPLVAKKLIGRSAIITTVDMLSNILFSKSFLLPILYYQIQVVISLNVGGILLIHILKHIGLSGIPQQLEYDCATFL